MPYRIVFTPSAERQFRKLTHQLQVRIRPRIDALAINPRPSGVKRLTGGFYRIRVGDYRLVYDIKDTDQVVEIAVIRHRRDVY